MKTTLPTLSYNPLGFEWCEDFHSSKYTKERAYPRTDLKHFVPWDTFEEEIKEAIDSRMSTMNIPSGKEYDIVQLDEVERVRNEDNVRKQADIQLHFVVKRVLKILGINGYFATPSCGNNQIIGEPDFSWLSELPTVPGSTRLPETVKHPKVVVSVSMILLLNGLIFVGQLEYKTKWACVLDNLPECFQEYRRKGQRGTNVLARQSVDALFQLYGYMTFNDNKYGILNNMQHAYVFRRIETADSEGKTLQYYGPINFHDSVYSTKPSMLKAFVGIILLAENPKTASTWFHSFPTFSDAPPARYSGISFTGTAFHQRKAAVLQAQSYNSAVVEGSYPVLPLDPRLCHFDRSAVRHSARGYTLKAKLLRVMPANSLNVFCKAVDLFQSGSLIDMLNMEVRNYATLQDLQSMVIPRVYGYYDVWGLMRLVALEDVGSAISEVREIDNRTKLLMKSALARIHSKGYVHGDIARRNFCMRENKVFVVDLETLRKGSHLEMRAELDEIDRM